MTSEQEKVMRMRYTMICGLLPLVNEKKKLSAAVKRTAEQYEVSVATVKRYLKLYQEQGMEGLIPAVRKERVELTQFEKDIRWGLNKFYYTTDKRSLTDAYTLLIKARYYKDGELLDERPSFYQFRYYYRKHRSISNQIISRQGKGYYMRNERPLLGDCVQEFAPAVGVSMLDSTICDIYLINEAGQLVGRPVLTACVDAHSGLCCGYSLGWEGGNYSLRQLMMNVVSDKVEHCRKMGIDITKSDWPCCQMPGRLVTDKGSEYASENFEHLADLGVTIENLPPYRPELKSVVEKFFDCVQSAIKPFIKGCGLIEQDFQERGSVDYRRQSCMTLREFEQILIRTVIYYNNHRILEGFPFSEEMLKAGEKPYASDVWNWSMEHDTGVNLIAVDAEKVRQILLPRTQAKFARRGLIVNRLRYRAIGFHNEYLDGLEVTVAYDPDNVNMVWLLEKGTFTPFELIESRYKDCDLDKVQELEHKKKVLIQNEKEAQLLAKVKLAEDIETIAVRARERDQLSPSKVKKMRETRKQEREMERLRKKVTQ